MKSATRRKLLVHYILLITGEIYNRSIGDFYLIHVFTSASFIIISIKENKTIPLANICMSSICFGKSQECVIVIWITHNADQGIQRLIFSIDISNKERHENKIYII